ncbi:MAG: hypothetical protein ACYC2Y_09270 [Armatimonadota bacterium]
MGASSQASAVDMEAVVRSLVNIISARVVTGSNGEIEEVHVLTDSSRQPKQLVRDIESALMAKFGMELDHKKVSIAQTQDGKNLKFSDCRVKFSDVSISLNGVKSQAMVNIRRNGDIHTGTAAGHSSSHNQLRLIATATIKAAESSRGLDGAFMLEDVDGSVVLSGRNIVVVCINMLTGRGEDFLTGSAIVKQDLWKAVVNATLDAVNRRLGFMDET